VVPFMASLCTLNALQNSSGQVVLQTPLPGKRGTLGLNRIEGLGTWAADLAVQKQFRIDESKSVTVRVDARNVFNHPTPALAGGLFAATPGAADLNLQSLNAFGTFNNKVGTRRFQLKARLDF
jgi:hypothetical protein